jgi:hypothetical protein
MGIRVERVFKANQTGGKAAALYKALLPGIQAKRICNPLHQLPQPQTTASSIKGTVQILLNYVFAFLKFKDC